LRTSESAQSNDLTSSQESLEPLFDELRHETEKYLEPEQIDLIHRAFLFGAASHKEQKRKSGELYITHPLAVASLMAEMRFDTETLIAAILHDVIEDTAVVKDEITTVFGDEVAELVDGVTKLTKINFETKAEAEAESMRKMLMAMVRDMRVMLIKLTDRLHNMRTLEYMRPDKRRRIARETLDIYVPIANRLGLNAMRLELEDLGFAALYPERHRVLAEAIKKARGNRREIIEKIESAISERLEQEGLNGRVRGREKHIYSIYQKMRRKGLPFSEVYDVYAFRINVDSVDMAYRVLGAVHNLYKPVPGKFKDYIAIPKANGYQSLHTVLFGPFGVPVEVQIRTEEMDKVAEAGVAAHWLYKTGEGSGYGTHARVREWMRNVLEMQQNAGDSLEFLENVKIDLFPREVYVFTPKGEIMVLKRGATPVDFAYAVHTDVGNRCVAAKIDRKLAPLRTPLMNGQTVEVITAGNASPNPAWLNFVVTGKARSNIRNYLKNLKRDEAVELGKRLLNNELASYSSAVDELPAWQVKALLDDLKLESLDQLLEDIGLGNRMAVLVARRLMPKEGEGGVVQKRGFKRALSRYMPSWLWGEKTDGARPLMIKGTEGMVVNFARCCRPIPGDPIVGFVTSGRGIVIHTDTCKNVAEYRKLPEKWIETQWEDDVKGDFSVEVRIEVINQRGVLATVAAAIAELGANIDNVNMEERDGRHSTMTMVIDVHSRQHLANLMRKIRTIKPVLRIVRSRG
jgi:guanosine-3',5'-bis(diphosphate) 3'-pyrophosphohydrolase